MLTNGVWPEYDQWSGVDEYEVSTVVAHGDVRIILHDGWGWVGGRLASPATSTLLSGNDQHKDDCCYPDW